MLSQSPDSSFKSAELDRLIKPLLNEPDERQRIRGYQEIDQYIADEGAVIPLVQYYQSVVHKSDLQFEPHAGGYVLPQDISSL
jgi:peptide/nickel transport system substrate-binding protein